MSVIKRLYVDNYKCLVNFELKLRKLALLLGSNGSGKTSVLDVIFAIRQLLRGEARVTDVEVFPTHSLTRWQNREIQIFELELECGDEIFCYRLEVEHHLSARRARIRLEELSVNEKFLFRCELGEVQLYSDKHIPGPTYRVDWSESALARVGEDPKNQNRRLIHFRESVCNIVICSLQPQTIVTESLRENSFLNRDGSNFASWYRYLIPEMPSQNADLNKSLQEIIEHFQTLRLKGVSEDVRALMAQIVRKDETFELRFDELSDGERVLVVLYSLVHFCKDGGVPLLLDEPDNFVALSEIQPWLIEMSDRCEESSSQAILCSHHPELIDYFAGEYGFNLSREISGVTTVKPVQTDNLEGGIKLSERFARGI